MTIIFLVESKKKSLRSKKNFFDEAGLLNQSAIGRRFIMQKKVNEKAIVPMEDCFHELPLETERLTRRDEVGVYDGNYMNKSKKSRI